MRRDVQIYAVMIVAAVASIASDPWHSVSDQLEAQLRGDPVVIGVDVLIERGLLDAHTSPVSPTFDISMHLEMDEREAGAIQSISSTLFALDAEGERTANLSSVTDAEIVELDDDAFSAALSHTQAISDCGTELRCVRRFEVEVDIDAAEPVAVTAFIFATTGTSDTGVVLALDAKLRPAADD